ncbi:hypothetical protein AB4865_03090 [Capnocytophaga sp. ARDL2]|uniref:hypothetical protein n=1 Tax=Capnocytophaga sp. ARDL2 TaxID=3238809 RepID=UPI0035587D1B
MANSYYFNALYAEANKYYGQLFAKYGSEAISEEYYYCYVQTLEHVGENALSKKYYDTSVQKVGSEKQVAKFRALEKELRDQIKANSIHYQDQSSSSLVCNHHTICDKEKPPHTRGVIECGSDILKVESFCNLI